MTYRRDLARRSLPQTTVLAWARFRVGIHEGTGGPFGIRTRVSGTRVRRLGPLDEGPPLLSDPRSWPGLAS